MTPVRVRGGVRLQVGFHTRSIPQLYGMHAGNANSSITSKAISRKNFTETARRRGVRLGLSFVLPSIFYVRVFHADVRLDSARLHISNASTDCRFTPRCLAHDRCHSTGFPSRDGAEVL